MTPPKQPPAKDVHFTGTTWTPGLARSVDRAMDALRQMTPDELFQSLVHAGIYSPDGKLLPPYADDGDQEETERNDRTGVSRR
jgi:hypothetical protein